MSWSRTDETALSADAALRVRPDRAGRRSEDGEVRDGTGSAKGRRGGWCAVAVCVVVATISGGCSVSDVQDALSSGVGNERAPVLVTAAEKEALGYESPEAMRNPDLQRLALEHRIEIYSAVEPFVEKSLGRDVEIVGFSAPYPYSTLKVKYRTLEDPVVASSAFVGLSSDGTVSSIERIDALEVQNKTVEGLYLVAYRQKIAQMTEYLAAAYPQFTQLPEGYARSLSQADSMYYFRNYRRYDEQRNIEEIKEGEGAIFQAYEANPSRTAAEWFDLFEQAYGRRVMHISLSLMLADPAEELTQEMGRRIADDVRSNPLFAGFGEWAIFVFGNQVLRDAAGSNIHHQQYLFRANIERPQWLVEYWQDGATVWSGRDGGVRRAWEDSGDGNRS